MDHNTLQNNNTLTESINLQQSAVIIQPEQSNIDHNAVASVNFSMMNNNNIFPTSHTNNDYSNHTLNENIASTSQSYPTYSTTTSYAPQYGHPPQPTENISPSLNGLNMTTINPSQSEIISFDIPGFKIIVVPTFSHTYSNSSDITNNQLTQFTVNAADSSAMNDNNISQSFYTNNNYSGQQSIPNENIASASQTSQFYSTNTSSYTPQYLPQPIGNIFSK